MKSELEKAIIEMGKLLQYPGETIDNFSDETLKMLSIILSLELDSRTNRLYN